MKFEWKPWPFEHDHHIDLVCYADDKACGRVEQHYVHGPTYANTYRHGRHYRHGCMTSVEAGKRAVECQMLSIRVVK